MDMLEQRRSRRRVLLRMDQVYILIAAYSRHWLAELLGAGAEAALSLVQAGLWGRVGGFWQKRGTVVHFEQEVVLLAPDAAAGICCCLYWS